MLKANIMLECIELLEGRSHDDDEEQAAAAAASPKREAATEEGLLCLTRLIATAGQRLEAENEDVRARIDQVTCAQHVACAQYVTCLQCGMLVCWPRRCVRHCSVSLAPAVL
jgi:hypothetical protein